MAEKSYLSTILRTHIALSESVSGNLLQKVRLDFAGEYSDKDMIDLLLVDGVKLELSPLYSSKATELRNASCKQSL